MISSELAVDVLIRVNQGTYKSTAYSTTSRQFELAYKNPSKEFILDPQLFNKVLSAYVSHEWINK